MTQRQKQILDEAMTLVIEEGISNLTMKKVAERMGFSEPALYRHFKNKQDMVIELIERIRGKYESVIGEIDRGKSPETYLLDLLCPLLTYLEEVKGITILFLSESTYNRDDRVRRALFSFYSSMVRNIADYLKDLRERGEIRVDVDLDVAAVMLVGTVQSLTIRYILSDGQMRMADKCKEILRIFLRGVLV